MAISRTTQVTQVLAAAGREGEAAYGQLFPLVYEELRRIAGAYFRHQPPGQTLQPTALVHEVFVKLLRDEPATARDRAHFLALAARVMRQILVDHARKRRRAKRELAERLITLTDSGAESGLGALDVIALDEALRKLADLSERKARLVELRFFGGLSEDDVAEVLQVSRTSAARDWRFARAWLLSELRGEAGR